MLKVIIFLILLPLIGQVDTPTVEEIKINHNKPYKYTYGILYYDDVDSDTIMVCKTGDNYGNYWGYLYPSTIIRFNIYVKNWEIAWDKNDVL
jgi:hypothetical protein